jgi:phosphatidylglycerophosphate synthase
MNGGRVHAVQTPVLPTVARGPANQVTLTRAVLSVAVALMVALAPALEVPVALIVGTTTVALALDWVDGQVARRTGTVTAFGARFDMEVDAFLILVLSVYVARSFGPWVLAIGLARYGLLAAGQVWPWLRRRVPPRYWRKVVAAVQGVVLTVATSAVLPHDVVAVALVGALLLLAESFGRDVLYLSRSRLATR